MEETSYLLVAIAAVALFAAAPSTSDAQSAPGTKPTPTADDALRATVTVDGSGYHPSVIRAKAGEKVTLLFRRVTDATCAVVSNALRLRRADV